MRLRVVCLSDGSAWIDSPENRHEIACRILAGASACVHEAVPPPWNKNKERGAIERAWRAHWVGCTDRWAEADKSPDMRRKYGDGPKIEPRRNVSPELRELESREPPPPVFRFKL